MIKTTLNLRKHDIQAVKKVMTEKGLSFSELTAIIITKIINTEYIILNISDAVKYQERENKDDWKIQHVRLSSDDYEILTGLRKIGKKSVSFIISEGIKKYLEEIYRKIERGEDVREKHRASGYFISNKIVNGNHHFKIIWGLPKNLQKGDNYSGKLTKAEDFFSVIRKVEKKT